MYFEVLKNLYQYAYPDAQDSSGTPEKTQEVSLSKAG